MVEVRSRSVILVRLCRGKPSWNSSLETGCNPCCCTLPIRPRSARPGQMGKALRNLNRVQVLENKAHGRVNCGIGGKVGHHRADVDCGAETGSLWITCFFPVPAISPAFTYVWIFPSPFHRSITSIPSSFFLPFTPSSSSLHPHHSLIPAPYLRHSLSSFLLTPSS